MVYKDWNGVYLMNVQENASQNHYIGVRWLWVEFKSKFK